MPELVAEPAAFRIRDRRQETHDTWTLDLEPVGDGIAPCAPGQFGMLSVFGVGEVPISVSAAPHVHTVRAVGAVTRALCRLDRGAIVGVRGPFGTAWPLDGAEGRDVVVVAGGLGLAPLRPVVHELLAHRERFGAVSVLCGGRSPAELLFLEELERWRARLDVTVEVIVDAPDGGWGGRVGVVTRLLPRAELDPAAAVAMVCGPELMMRFTAQALVERGLAPERIWLSLERSMKCAVGHCGHCQLGPLFICKDGPVASHAAVAALMAVREL